MTKTDAEIYFDHFDAMAGREARFARISDEGAWPPLHVLCYPDTPEPGYLSAVTYGLSLVKHPEWLHGTVELMISVRTKDIVWAHAMGDIAYRLRGECPFAYGDTVRFGTTMTHESGMDAFVTNWPIGIDPDGMHVDLSDRIVHIAQVYPIYQGEIGLIHANGVDWLFKHKDYDPYDVQRPDFLKQP